MTNFVRKYGAAGASLARKGAVGATGLALSGLAMAQETDPFNTAIDTITDKVETYGGALVALAAVGVVFMVGIKYIKKIRGAA